YASETRTGQEERSMSYPSQDHGSDKAADAGAVLLFRPRSSVRNARMAVTSARIIRDPRLCAHPVRRSLDRLALAQPATGKPAFALAGMVQRLLGQCPSSAGR